MRWFKPNLRNSLYGMLGHAMPSDTRVDAGMEDIRDCMLALLGDQGPRKFTALHRRLRFADDIQALWYLRGDLMAALASLHGEAEARDRIRTVTDMFSGLLPGGLTSRPSPLIG